MGLPNPLRILSPLTNLLPRKVVNTAGLAFTPYAASQANQAMKPQVGKVQSGPQVGKVPTAPSAVAGPANYGSAPAVRPPAPMGANAAGGADSTYSKLLGESAAGTRQRSPEELKHLENVSELARTLGGQGQNLYNIGSPAYAKAMDYYNRILSGDKGAVTQAIAPEAEMLAEFGNAQQKSIEQGGLRGGARDTALAETGRSSAGQISNLIPQARKDAAAAAAGHGLAGAQAGAGIEQGAANTYSGLLGSAQESRQFGADLQAKIAFGMRSGDLEAAKLDLERYLGEKGLGLQELMGMSDLALRREMGLLGFDMDKQKIDLMRQQMNAELQRSRGDRNAGIGGAIGAILGAGVGMLVGGPKGAQAGSSMGQLGGSAAGSLFK